MINEDVRHQISETVSKVQKIMTDVSTGGANIDHVNSIYKQLYNELDSKLRDQGLDNPNDFSDLWEFYAYWKDSLKSYADRRAYVISLYKRLFEKKLEAGHGSNFVDTSRLLELKSISSSSFDLTKLIRLCEEINIASKNQCYFTVGLLVRAILDHVPPVFSRANFLQVVSNYGPRSFKDSIASLENSSRKIADGFLHTPIRKTETLPNWTQVNFSQNLDVLLAEICRLLK